MSIMPFPGCSSASEKQNREAIIKTSQAFFANQNTKLRDLPLPGIFLKDAVFSPDGRFVAGHYWKHDADRGPATVEDRRRLEAASIYVWEVATGRRLFELKPMVKRGFTAELEFSQDGKYLLSEHDVYQTIEGGPGGGNRYEARLWDMSNGRLIREVGAIPDYAPPYRYGHNGPAHFLEDGQRIIYVTSYLDYPNNSYELTIEDLITGKKLKSFSVPHCLYFRAEQISPDNRSVAFLPREIPAVVSVFDLQTGQLKFKQEISHNSTYQENYRVIFSPDNGAVYGMAAGGGNSNAAVTEMNAITGEIAGILQGEIDPNNPMTKTYFEEVFFNSRDKKLIAQGWGIYTSWELNGGRTMNVWRVEKGNNGLIETGPHSHSRDGVYSIASNDAELCSTPGASCKRFQLLEIDRQVILHSFPVEPLPLTVIHEVRKISPDARYILATNPAGGLSLWPSPFTTQREVRGKVLDAQTNEPIRSAEILVYYRGDFEGANPIRQRSDERGEFNFTLPDIDFEVTFKAGGYAFETVFFGQYQEWPNSAREIKLTQLKQGNRFVVRNILFDLNKSTLRPESKKELLRAAALLLDNSGIMVEIRGHTDNTGNDAGNEKLSLDRADAVRNFLVQLNVPADRMSATGAGSKEPIGLNSTDEGRAMNRRIEFWIKQ